MWPCANVGSDRSVDRILQSLRGRGVVWVWRPLARRAGAAADLCLECADGPALIGCASCEDPAASVVGFGEQRLSVTLGQYAGVDQLDRLVWQVEQADGMRDVGSASPQPL